VTGTKRRTLLLVGRRSLAGYVIMPEATAPSRLEIGLTNAIAPTGPLRSPSKRSRPSLLPTQGAKWKALTRPRARPDASNQDGTVVVRRVR